MINILNYIIFAGFLAIAYGYITGKQILSASPGNKKMQEIAEAIKVGAELSSKRNDLGYKLAAELMSRLGIRGQEIKDISKDIINSTTVNGKKEYYIFGYWCCYYFKNNI